MKSSSQAAGVTSLDTPDAGLVKNDSQRDPRVKSDLTGSVCSSEDLEQDISGGARGLPKTRGVELVSKCRVLLL